MEHNDRCMNEPISCALIRKNKKIVSLLPSGGYHSRPGPYSEGVTGVEKSPRKVYTKIFGSTFLRNDNDR